VIAIVVTSVGDMFVGMCAMTEVGKGAVGVIADGASVEGMGPGVDKKVLRGDPSCCEGINSRRRDD